MNAESAAPGPLQARRPRVVDAAAVVAFAAAAVNLVIAGLVIAQVTASGAAVQPALVAVLVAITVAYAAALVVLILLFRRGRSWARGAFVSVASLSLLTLFALNALNLTVILLLVAASVLLYRRPVSDWVRQLRGLRRA